MNAEESPIIIEQIFDSPIKNVWNSITEITQMRQWYFSNIPKFKPKVGFETKFNVKSQDRNFLHKWKIINVIHEKLITYNWKYEGYSGDSNVTFELFNDNNKTKLRLTHQVVESFADNISEFKRESCEAGWKYFIQQSLKEFLQKSK
jgi:uncharacterized protein YndB with AHSA1/START domain